MNQEGLHFHQRSGMSPRIEFRVLRQEDILALRELQLALFPVRYTDKFYNRLFSHGDCLPLLIFSRSLSHG